MVTCVAADEAASIWQQRDSVVVLDTRDASAFMGWGASFEECEASAELDVGGHLPGSFHVDPPLRAGSEENVAFWAQFISRHRKSFSSPNAVVVIGPRAEDIATEFTVECAEIASADMSIVACSDRLFKLVDAMRSAGRQVDLTQFPNFCRVVPPSLVSSSARSRRPLWFNRAAMLPGKSRVYRVEWSGRHSPDPSPSQSCRSALSSPAPCSQTPGCSAVPSPCSSPTFFSGEGNESEAECTARLNSSSSTSVVIDTDELELPHRNYRLPLIHEEEPPATSQEMGSPVGTADAIERCAAFFVRHGFTQADFELGVQGEDASPAIILVAASDHEVDRLAVFRVATTLQYLGVADVRVVDGFPPDVDQELLVNATEPGLAVSAAAKEAMVDLLRQRSTCLNSSSSGRSPVLSTAAMANIVEEGKETNSGHQWFDVRTEDELAGVSGGYKGIDVVRGGIPGAKPLASTKTGSVYAMDDWLTPSPFGNRMRVDTAGHPFKEHGIVAAAGRRSIFYCGSGWRASEAMFCAEVLFTGATTGKGITAQLYSDGWLHWSRTPEVPVTNSE